jgi:hypothetical protein
MKEYLILLRGGDARMADLTDEENAAHMQKWVGYMKDLAEKGHLAGGLPLQIDGRLVTNEGVLETVVRSESGEAVGGYLIFKASDYVQAVELVKNCPIFEHDGNVEVREMAPMEM